MLLKKIIRLSLTLFSGSFFFTATAQQAWTIYNSSSSPLPDNQVLAVAVDNSNNKWIGTPSGLAVYDDVSWTTYTTSNSGIPDNDVRSVAFDSTGNVWVGTFTGGVAKFDGTNWTVYNNTNSGLPDNYVRSLAVDGQNNIWIGTTGGLAKYDGNTWTVWNSTNSQFISENIATIAIRGNTKYIGTVNGGVVYLSDTSFTSYTIANSGLQDNTVLSMALDSAGNRWMATVGQGGMEHTINNFWFWLSPSLSQMPAWSVYGVTVDEQEDKYFATFAGLAKLSGNSWTIYNTSNSPLPDDYFRCIAKDHNNAVWAGSNSIGLVRLDEAILNYIDEADIPKQLPLYPTALRSGDNVWLQGTKDAVLMIYDQAGRLCMRANTGEGVRQLKIDLGSGMYYAAMITGRGTLHAKLVVTE